MCLASQVGDPGSTWGPPAPRLAPQGPPTLDPGSPPIQLPDWGCSHPQELGESGGPGPRVLRYTMDIHRGHLITFQGGWNAPRFGQLGAKGAPTWGSNRGRLSGSNWQVPPKPQIRAPRLAPGGRQGGNLGVVGGANLTPRFPQFQPPAQGGLPPELGGSWGSLWGVPGPP